MIKSLSMGFVRALIRLTLFAFGSIYIIGRYSIKAFFVGHDLDRVMRLRRMWFKTIHNILGVKIITKGSKPSTPGIIMCNHRSYFDPIIVLSQIIALPVGKAEVAKWPIIGLGARVSGSIFVERKSKEGRKRARKEILETVQKGYSVVTYPEGTTHIGDKTMPFNPGMFHDASSNEITIHTVVHEYQLETDAWINDDTFLRHFFHCFAKKETHVKLSYGPTFSSKSPEQLISQTKNWMDQEIIKLRVNWFQSSRKEL